MPCRGFDSAAVCRVSLCRRMHAFACMHATAAADMCCCFGGVSGQKKENPRPKFNPSGLGMGLFPVSDSTNRANETAAAFS